MTRIRKKQTCHVSLPILTSFGVILRLMIGYIPPIMTSTRLQVLLLKLPNRTAPLTVPEQQNIEI